MTYHLNLIENGIDFVKSGIETYFAEDTPDPRAHKYAILHMFSGVLLLLKERLARINLTLVFEEPAKCGKPGAKTTDYDKTIGRLEANSVKIERVQREILDEIRGLRNDIEHYEVHLDLARAKEVIGELAAFVYTFCADELQFNIDERFSDAACLRFYHLKGIGDRLLEEALTTANADAKADDAYLRTFEEKYAAMAPRDVLEMVASGRGVTVDAVECVECPACRETTFVLLEVGVCVNGNCRTTRRIGECHSCQGTAFDGAYYCERCRYG
jgi:GNAT superfamily N-acetyltransferase